VAIPLVVPTPFKKVMGKKPAELQSAISRIVLLLGQNTRHPSLQTHPMRGTKGVFEAYVDKKNRVTFHYESGKIVLRRNCDHRILKRP
jgi:hypothetical protein